MQPEQEDTDTCRSCVRPGGLAGNRPRHKYNRHFADMFQNLHAPGSIVHFSCRGKKLAVHSVTTGRPIVGRPDHSLLFFFATLVIIVPDANEGDARAAREAADRIAGILAKLGVGTDWLPESDVTAETLAKRRLAILPYNRPGEAV